MSWRGFKKALSRVPIVIKQKAGIAEETTDHDYKQFDAEYDATSAANKELVAAFNSTEKAVKLFLAKLQILGECSPPPVEELLEKSRNLFNDLSLPALHDLTTVYKRVHDRMVKRRHKLFDYDKLRLALAKADPHKVAKLQIKYDAAAREYNSHNESLKRELPQLFRLRKELVETLMKEYDAFMNEFFLVIQRLLNNFSGGQSKSFTEIQTDFNKHEQMINEMLSGLSLVSMNARRSESAVDQLTSKIKDTFKKEKISSIANRSRSTTTYSQRTFEASMSHVPSANTNDITNMVQQRKLELSQVNLKPSVQPNAKQDHPPPPPPQINSKKSMLAVAMFDFNGQENGDLIFKAGERIEIIKKTESKDDWWTGRVKGREGIFPANYVKDL